MCGLSRQLLQVFTIYFKFITKCDSFFYHKVRWSVITKCDSFFITKCDKCYYKVRQVLQSVTILLQSAPGITKCDSTHGNSGHQINSNLITWIKRGTPNVWRSSVIKFQCFWIRRCAINLKMFFVSLRLGSTKIKIKTLECLKTSISDIIEYR